MHQGQRVSRDPTLKRQVNGPAKLAPKAVTPYPYRCLHAAVTQDWYTRTPPTHVPLPAVATRSLLHALVICLCRCAL